MKKNANCNLDKQFIASIKTGKLRLPAGYTIPATHKHKSSFKTIRKSEYRGKKLRVETTYKITIDGEPLTSHTTVLDDGTVHCHDFPNYSFPSAIDMTRKVVDTMIDFTEPEDELSKHSDVEHGEHNQ